MVDSVFDDFLIDYFSVFGGFGEEYVVVDNF